MGTKIKPGGWLLIGLLVLALGGFAYRYFHLKSTNPTYAASVSSTAESNDTGGTVGSIASAGSTSSNYSVDPPDEPVDGTLFGVVEVGASGFNSFVVDEDKQNRWKIISKDFGESLSYEGLANVDDIKDGLKKYLAKMLNKGVGAKNLHFVVSSGALKNPKTTDIMAAIAKMGYVVNKVTPQEEGQFAAISTIIPKYRDKSFSLDIGSGNSKISWYDKSGSIKSVEASGAKYFQNGISDADAATELSRAASQVPRANREVCFIIGGTPYEFAKQSGIQKDQRYIDLIDPAKLEDKGEAKNKSGIVIYKAVRDATGTSNFVFDADANFTIGFLLRLKH